MNYACLGRSGLRVSTVCLGTSVFGGQCSEAESHAILDAALHRGITFIDTADIYPSSDDFRSSVGRTEEIIGRWVSRHRDEVVVATKCYGPTGVSPWDRGLSRKHIIAATDASLRRLGTEYIDLLQVHQWDDTVPLDETLFALDTLVKVGKVRYIGCSNYLGYQLARALGRSDLHHLERCASVQVRYSLLYRSAERELLPCCVDEGVSALPYNVLAGGLLTGKHQRDKVAPNTRFTAGFYAPELYRRRYWQEDKFEAIDALRSLSSEAGVGMIELAIGWALAQPPVTTIVVGASKPLQLDAACIAADTSIEPDVLRQLDTISERFKWSPDSASWTWTEMPVSPAAQEGSRTSEPSTGMT